MDPQNDGENRIHGMMERLGSMDPWNVGEIGIHGSSRIVTRGHLPVILVGSAHGMIRDNDISSLFSSP